MSSSPPPTAAAVVAASPVFLAQALGIELVTLFVGPKLKEFVVHKALLCQIPFFRAGFTGGFKESEENKMYLPEDHLGGFSLFIDWVYRSTIPRANTKSHVCDLYYLYLLAHKLLLNDLLNKAMDQIQSVSLEVYVMPDDATVIEVYKNTPEGSRLRVFCQMAKVYKIFQKWDKLEDKKTTACTLNDDDLEKLLDLEIKCRETFKDFFHHYEAGFELMSGKTPESRISRTRRIGVSSTTMRITRNATSSTPKPSQPQNPLPKPTRIMMLTWRRCRWTARLEA